MVSLYRFFLYRCHWIGFGETTRMVGVAIGLSCPSPPPQTAFVPKSASQTFVCCVPQVRSGPLYCHSGGPILWEGGDEYLDQCDAVYSAQVSGVVLDNQHETTRYQRGEQRV